MPKLEPAFKRTLIALGNYSLVISVPKEIIQKFGWQKGKLVKIIPSKRKTLLIREVKSN